MILGVGTDIVAVARITRALARFGPPFAERILTDAELVRFRDNGCAANFLAKRFAAKEAAAKALGTGFRHGIRLRDIEVIRERGRPPALRFYGAATVACREQGVRHAHLSLADERDYAVAFVVLEGSAYAD